MISKTFRIARMIVLASFALSSAAWAATCSNASLSGTYGLLTRGTAVTGLPVTSLIQFTFDPTTATFTSVETSSRDGVITTTPINGTYGVASNCTGRTTVDQSLHVGFVVTSTGFLSVNLTTGRTIEGPGVQQGFPACTNAGATGSFGFEATGVFVAGAPVTGPVAFIGELKLSLDPSGEGVISGHVAGSEDGTIFTFAEERVTGSYKVDANCTGKATITPEGQPELNFRFVIVDDGNEMLAIETDADTVVSGTLQR
jgi:hypothetical protein